MSEDAPGANELFTLMLRVTIFTVVTMFIIGLFISFHSDVEARFIERDAIHLAENLYSSDATFDRVILVKEQLDKAISGGERFAHICDKGYYATITNLITGESWEFGYKPNKKVKLKEASVPLISAIVQQGKAVNYETSQPAKIYLTVYDTYTTRITCMIEKAFLSKEVQKIQLPCLFRGSSTDCAIEIVQTGDELCIKNPSGSEPTDCRFSRYQFLAEPFNYDATEISGEKLSKQLLKAYPLKAGASGESCDSLRTSAESIAQNKEDEVIAVKLCMEDG